jgi:hypothetical protein
MAPLDAGSTLIFQLQVSDGKESSVPSPFPHNPGSQDDDIVAVSIVPNSPPVADAGADQTKDEGNVVTLNGLGSYDPDLDDHLTFQWQQRTGTPVVLGADHTPTPSFTAPPVSPGGETLTFGLLVNDDDPINPKTSKADEVRIHVRNINDPPSCHLAHSHNLWPPNHKMIELAIEGVIDADAVYNDVTLRITGVSQDEPVNGLGDGDTSPDAVIQPSNQADSVLIRAERSGTGNGRVYAVDFKADDGFESCTGSVGVTVPHSRNSTAIDDGQLFNSTLP